MHTCMEQWWQQRGSPTEYQPRSPTQFQSFQSVLHYFMQTWPTWRMLLTQVCFNVLLHNFSSGQSNCRFRLFIFLYTFVMWTSSLWYLIFLYKNDTSYSINTIVLLFLTYRVLMVLYFSGYQLLLILETSGANLLQKKMGVIGDCL